MRILRSAVVFGLVSAVLTLGATSATADQDLPNDPDAAIVFTVVPPELTNKKTASFEFTVPGETTCQLDGGEVWNCSGSVSLSDLTDGSHTFTVTSSEGASAIHQWRVDTVKPDLRFRHSIKGWTGNNTPVTGETSASFTFSTPDPTTELMCRIDPPITYVLLEPVDRSPIRIPMGSGPFVPCASPQALSDLPEGLHIADVRAVDDAGNISPSGIRWVVDYEYVSPDTTPPTISFDGPRQIDPYTFEASFRVSEEATLRCWHKIGPLGSVMVRPLESCASPITLTDIPEGLNELTIEATDASGNRRTQGRGWTVDRTPPVVLIASAPEDTTGPTSVFRFSSSETKGPQSFQCSLDDGLWAPCASPVELSALTHGQHAFSIKATDAFGNTSEPETTTWSVDDEAPEARIISGPAAVSSSAEASLRVEIDGDAARLECSLDGLPWEGCSPEIALTGLEEGPHSFRVRASDGVGNTGPVATFQWVVDRSGPTVVLGSRPGEASSSSTARFTWTSESGARFECRVDTQPWSDCLSPTSFSALQDGPHTFEVRGVDQVGNAGPVSSHSWNVAVPQPPANPTDPGPVPTAAIVSGPSDRTASRSASFVVRHSEGTTLSCRSSLLPFPFLQAWKPCTSPIVLNGLWDGGQSFEVRASDPAGRVSASRSWRWTVDTSAPVVTISANPLLITTTTLASFSFRSNDRDATFRCSLDSGPWSACSGPAEYSGLEPGEHLFEVVAVDFLGNRSTPIRYIWEVVLPTPDFEIFAETDPEVVLEPEPQPLPEPQPEPEQQPAPESNPGDDSAPVGEPALLEAVLRALGSPVIRSAPSKTTSQRPLFRISAPAPGTANFCSIDRGRVARCGSVWRPARKLSSGWHSFTVQGRAGDGRLSSAVNHRFRVTVSR